MKKNGRPSSYTPELALEICSRLANGESLRQICKDSHIPAMSTVMLWALENREGFSEQYAKARELQAESMFEEILEIADDGSNDWIEKESEAGRIIEVPDSEHINRSRLRVDTRKWYLSKVLPKKFGEKTEIIGKMHHQHTVELVDLDERANQLLKDRSFVN